jgi:L-ascorbate metabolism protein UlaG (beta-lactamase superfamily)
MGSGPRPAAESRIPVNLIEDIDQTLTATPTLWWLGRAGFVVRFANITFYVDPWLSRQGALLDASAIHNADMILATHAHPGHLDAPSVIAMLEGSKAAKLILPKSAADQAHAAGIPYPRMTTTDADLRVEYFKDNLYARIYAVPSAHPQLDRTPMGGYPYLGYLIRFGRWTVYHAGDCVPYEMLVERLRPYNVSVALLPVGGKNFSVSEAAQLAEDIGAKWLAPMHYESGQENDFVTHMLGQRPHQQFKVFQAGEKWTVPEE